MKVTLNIQDDTELRLHIKDAIKGQVLSVLRSDILDIVKEEITRKVKGLTVDNLDRMISSAVYQIIERILRTIYKVSEWDSDFVKPIIEARVEKAIANKDWDKLIDQMATKKVKELLDKK